MWLLPDDRRMPLEEEHRKAVYGKTIRTDVCPGKARLFSGKQAHQGKSLSPVAWMAAWRETETLKPIDKAIVEDGERVPGP
jgi:hypothetical protein